MPDQVIVCTGQASEYDELARQVNAAREQIASIVADMRDYHTRHNPACECETVEVATEVAEQILAAMEERKTRFWWEVLDAVPDGAGRCADDPWKRRAEQAEAAVVRVREAAHIADADDVTDWQRGYRACSERLLAALDHPADGEHTGDDA